MSQIYVTESYVYGSVALADGYGLEPEVEVRTSLRLVPEAEAPKSRENPRSRRASCQARASQRGAVVVMSLLAVLLGVVWLGVSSWQIRSFEAVTSGIAVERVQVAPGQGLLDVAEEHPIAGLDSTQTARWIFERNGLSRSMLEAGQYLEVAR